jgi:hypothetical protein
MRSGRSDRDARTRAASRKRRAGIEFVSIREAVDISTPDWTGRFHIAGAFGQHERE